MAYSRCVDDPDYLPVDKFQVINIIVEGGCLESNIVIQVWSDTPRVKHPQSRFEVQ